MWFRRGRGWKGPWPGNGPWSHLPPWERPGWRFGRGYCWRIYYSKIYQHQQPITTDTSSTYHSQDVYTKLYELNSTIKKLEKTIEELKKQLENYKH